MGSATVLQSALVEVDHHGSLKRKTSQVALVLLGLPQGIVGLLSGLNYAFTRLIGAKARPSFSLLIHLQVSPADERTLVWVSSGAHALRWPQQRDLHGASGEGWDTRQGHGHSAI